MAIKTKVSDIRGPIVELDSNMKTTQVVISKHGSLYILSNHGQVNRGVDIMLHGIQLHRGCDDGIKVGSKFMFMSSIRDFNDGQSKFMGTITIENMKGDSRFPKLMEGSDGGIYMCNKSEISMSFMEVGLCEDRKSTPFVAMKLTGSDAGIIDPIPSGEFSEKYVNYAGKLEISNDKFEQWQQK